MTDVVSLIYKCKNNIICHIYIYLFILKIIAHVHMFLIYKLYINIDTRARADKMCFIQN